MNMTVLPHADALGANSDPSADQGPGTFECLQMHSACRSGTCTKRLSDAEPCHVIFVSMRLCKFKKQQQNCGCIVCQVHPDAFRGHACRGVAMTHTLSPRTPDARQRCSHGSGVFTNQLTEIE
jgi:hypothetical protein